VNRARTIPDVAKDFGVSERTVQKWVEAGELRAVNVSRDRNSKKPRLRVLDSDLQAFLAGRTVGTERKQSRRRGRPKAARKYV